MKETKKKEKAPKNPFKGRFTADFETTTDPNDCRVWAYGINSVEDPDKFEYGNTIDGFIEKIQKMGNCKLYFHNLKFDGQFIIDYLMKHGFQFCADKQEEELYSRSFTPTISDAGLFYAIRIVFGTWKKKKHFVEIFDSAKIIPFSVEAIAESFGLTISKLKIDYEAYREVGHELTTDEVDYLRNDVKIMALALRTLFEQGLTKMTQASNALFDYKRIIGKHNFEYWFPFPDYDADVRKSYKGGFTWLNPKYKYKNVGEGLVLDVNSLYPWAMYYCKLPFSSPIYYEGEYEEDPIYDVFVQQFSCRFRLKKDHIPTVQIKNTSRFVDTEYLTTSVNYVWDDENQEWYEEDEPVLLTMTSVDLKLFFDHYEVFDIEYINGYKFKSQVGMFKDYIDKWMRVKEESTKNGNKGMRTLAKLMLNALYGKFATSTTTCSKIPYLENGVVKYENGPVEVKSDSAILYIPVGAFITAYAREKTIRSAQKVYDKFIYADTDSLHLDMPLPKELSNLTNDDLEVMTTEDFINAGVEFPEDFEIDPYALGAWKVESRFFRGKYIRAKTYLEDWNRPELWNKAGKEEFNSKELKAKCKDEGLNYKEELKKYEGMYDRGVMNITCAGMPKTCYKHVTWDNFLPGAKYPGKLMPLIVNGGVVLTQIDFTIKK